MKNLLVILVLLFSALSFSQKIVTPKSFPVKVTVSGDNVKMNVPSKCYMQVYIYKVGVKEPISQSKYNSMGFETTFNLSKGKYTIKVIDNERVYTNKFSV